MKQNFLEPISSSIKKFFLMPASSKPLGALRIGLGLTLLWQACSIGDAVLSLMASDGVVPFEVMNRLHEPRIPNFSGLIQLLSSFGVTEKTTLLSLALSYCISLLLLTVGMYTRYAAIVAWFLNWLFMNTGYSGTYGVDTYTHVFLFYLMWVPCAGAYSLDAWVGRVSRAPSVAARLGLRVMQLQLCISYLASGIEKSMSPLWWNGEVPWEAFTLPSYSRVDLHWMAQVPWLPVLLGLSTLLVEAGYCVFIWKKSTRWIWIFATCMLHMGIVIFLQLPIFGILMCILTLTIFGVSADPVEEPLFQKSMFFFWRRNPAVV